MPAEPLDMTLLAAVCVSEGYPEPAREHRFHPERKWRFDLAWPELMVAFEREGLVAPGAKGRHQTRQGYRGDCEKYNAALRLGWVVVRATGGMVRDGSAATDLLGVLSLAREWQRAAERVQTLNLWLAERVARQSECLSRAAERRGA